MIRLPAALLSLCLAAGLTSAAAAQSATGAPGTPRTVDMAQLTCSQFMEALNSNNSDVIGIYVIWLDGYASAIGKEAGLDTGWIEPLAETVAESCVGRLNARATVLSIVQQAREQLRR